MFDLLSGKGSAPFRIFFFMDSAVAGHNFMGEETFIIVGLGNPGEKYIGTRHNIGFMVVDELAVRCKRSFTLEKWDSLSLRVSLFGTKVCLVKPLTYMNVSGKAVVKFVDFYKTPLHRLLVIHDDLDMKPGRIKLICGGGSGGHNGIRSLIQHLGGNDFFRLKIGIGKPGQGSAHPDMPVEHYVLAQFSGEERATVACRMNSLIQGIEYYLQDDADKAMNLLNGLK
jgi:peptidyl-tRNA hydrolase, PTH1 family